MQTATPMPMAPTVAPKPSRRLFAMSVYALGVRHNYEGIFANSVDATHDALNRFGPHACIHVKSLREVAP